jgi:hypothetical protein
LTVKRSYLPIPSKITKSAFAHVFTRSASTRLVEMVISRFERLHLQIAKQLRPVQTFIVGPTMLHDVG